MNAKKLHFLYADGFPEDSAEFREYFIRAYGRNAVILGGDDPIGVGYLVPKRAVIAGREQKAFYIDAFSIYTPYRGKGHSRPLMRMLLETARKRGATYVLLSPFDPVYYKQYGFVNVSYTSDKIITGGEDFAVADCTAAELAAIYNRAEGNRLLMEVQAARRKLREYAVDRLRVLNVGGFAVGAVIGRQFDLIAGDGNRLLACEALKGLETRVSGGAPRVQARVVNARSAAADAGMNSGRITDTILDENNISLSTGPDTDIRTIAENVFGHTYEERVRKNFIFDEI